MAKKEGIAPDVIAIVGQSLFDMALGDIHRALNCDFPRERIRRKTILKDGECILGAVIQACCLIEAAGHYSHNADSSETAFTDFATKYMNSYNATELYRVLRCGLIHAYKAEHEELGVQYVLIKNAPEHHLKKVPKETDKIFFDVNSFIEDVDSAVTQFIKASQKEEKPEYKNTVARATHAGFMGIQSVQLDSYSSLNGCLMSVVGLGSAYIAPQDIRKYVNNATATISQNNVLYSHQLQSKYDRPRTRK